MDAIAEWTAAQRRVVELMGGVSAEQAEQQVPACPDWTARQLLSHMVGLGADVLGGDEPDDHNDAWTQQQVDARAGHSVTDLLEEWDGIADGLRAWMAANSPRPLGDVIIHEQDLRGALGRSGGQDTAGLAAIRDRMLERFADAVADLPPVTLDGGSWTWTSAGAAVGDVVVRAPEFELARALMSRRSRAQLAGWTVAGDIAPYLDAFRTLGSLPTDDLSE